MLNLSPPPPPNWCQLLSVLSEVALMTNRSGQVRVFNMHIQSKLL